MLQNITIHIAGENALILYFSEQYGGQVSANISAKVQQTEQLIRKAMEQELAEDIIDLVPSYASLMVMFNMVTTDHHLIKNKLRILLQQTEGNSKEQLIKNEANIVELPVYYSNESGPDLSVIAQRAQ